MIGGKGEGRRVGLGLSFEEKYAQAKTSFYLIVRNLLPMRRFQADDSPLMLCWMQWLTLNHCFDVTDIEKSSRVSQCYICEQGSIESVIWIYIYRWIENMIEVIPKCAEIAKIYRRESVLYGENLSYGL